VRGQLGCVLVLPVLFCGPDRVQKTPQLRPYQQKTPQLRPYQQKTPPTAALSRGVAKRLSTGRAVARGAAGGGEADLHTGDRRRGHAALEPLVHPVPPRLAV